MQIRKAENYDLEAILNLYQMAREFMAAHGNPGQFYNIPSLAPPYDLIQCFCQMLDLIGSGQF